jgi:Flp pilus assembly pilin Flp
MQVFKRFLVEDEGAEIAEYALLIVLLAIAVLVGAPQLSTAVQGAFTGMGGQVSSNTAKLPSTTTTP